MSNVIKMIPKKHIYKLDDCSGCHNKIEVDQEYQEISYPNYEETEITHIALCNKCFEIAEDHGVKFN